jgi:hypothetical protein
MRAICFNERDMKHFMGMSANRATKDSYWKAIGKGKVFFN